MEINKVSALKFREHGLQVIDLYMSLQSLISKRKEDGIHWTPEANRLMTNKILTHICLVYGHPLPGRLQSEAFQKLINIKTVQDVDIQKNRKQRNRSRNSDLITLLKLLKVQIPVDKSDSIESEVMTICEKLRSRSIDEVLTSKMRRRAKLGKLRSNKRNAPMLDFVKKRKANIEINSNHAGGKSKKHCLEKPLESKRLNVKKWSPSLSTPSISPPRVSLIPEMQMTRGNPKRCQEINDIH